MARNKPTSVVDELVASLAAIRKARGLSLRDVARRMGTDSAASLWQWESGARRPGADYLVEWAAALDQALILQPARAREEARA